MGLVGEVAVAVFILLYSDCHFLLDSPHSYYSFLSLFHYFHLTFFPLTLTSTYQSIPHLFLFLLPLPLGNNGLEVRIMADAIHDYFRHLLRR